MLCERELAVYRSFSTNEDVKEIFPMLIGDFIEMMVGPALSVVLVAAVVFLG